LQRPRNLSWLNGKKGRVIGKKINNGRSDRLMVCGLEAPSSNGLGANIKRKNQLIFHANSNY
jgi:hypothetical protein